MGQECKKTQSLLCYFEIEEYIRCCTTLSTAYHHVTTSSNHRTSSNHGLLRKFVSLLCMRVQDLIFTLSSSRYNVLQHIVAMLFGETSILCLPYWDYWIIQNLFRHQARVVELTNYDFATYERIGNFESRYWFIYLFSGFLLLLSDVLYFVICCSSHTEKIDFSDLIEILGKSCQVSTWLSINGVNVSNFWFFSIDI